MAPTDQLTVFSPGIHPEDGPDETVPAELLRDSGLVTPADAFTAVFQAHRRGPRPHLIHVAGRRRQGRPGEGGPRSRSGRRA